MLPPLVAIAALPLAAYALDIPDDNRMVQQDGILRFPMKASVGLKSVGKRQDVSSLASRQTGSFYSIDLVLGMPGQTVSVNVDTGSSELWVNPECSTSYNPAYCESFGRFTESTTFHKTQNTGYIPYGTGFVDFAYGYDYVGVGSARLNQQIMGVSNASEYVVTGIMGIAPSLDGFDSPYPFVVDNLAQQGFINSRAFSLDLHDIDSTRSSLVFGGIDTKKYRGALERRPIIPAAEAPDQYTRFWIFLDGMSVVGADGKKTTVFAETNGQAIVLDSGSTMSSLPSSIFEPLLAAFPSAKRAPNQSTYTVDCSLMSSKGAVEFVFGRTTISVPYADFFWQQADNECILGAISDDEYFVLGDTFLRGAYAVFDWDNEAIHLAQADDCGSNLVAIGKGPDSVPSRVGECGVKPTMTVTTKTTTKTMTKTIKKKTSTSTTSKPLTTTTELSTKASSLISASNSTSKETSVTKTSTHEASARLTSMKKNETAGPTTYGSLTTDYATTTPASVYTSRGNATTSAAASWHNVTITTAAPTTRTYTTTTVYTVTSCPPSVTNCPVGSVTTDVITAYTTWCPETTGTYSLPSSHSCYGGGCPGGPGPGKPTTVPPLITVVPMTTHTAPQVVPGWSSSTTTPVISTPPQTSPAAATSAAVVPVTTMCSTCAGNSTVPPAATGGASSVWPASGATVAVAGFLAVFLL